MREARLGDVVASMKNGIYKPASEYSDDGMPCLRMYNIDAGSIVWRDIKRMRIDDREFADYGLHEGDLLVNRVNSRELVGKAAYIPASLEPCVFESKNIRLRLDRTKALPKFINYQLFARGSRHFANNAQQVVGMASISQGQLADFPIVLTDLDEQHSIVAEIEEQFSRLDEAVANLQRVKANLRRFKTAILKDAVEGRLVANEVGLSKSRGTAVASTSDLLQDLQRERRRRWNSRGPYREPERASEAVGFDLPPGWAVVTVAQLSWSVEYGSSAKTNEDATGVPVLRMGNLVDGQLLFDDLKYLPAAHAEFPKLLLEEGDILFNRTNSPELVGKTAVFKSTTYKCSFASYLIRVRALSGCLPDFLAAYINSTHGRQWVKSVVTQQVGQANVNGSKLQALAVPVPPLAEQRRIVAEVDRRLSIVREVEAEVDANLRRAQALRQAVLRKAFAG